jgi:predicted AAA+ superfamily ATPase
MGISECHSDEPSRFIATVLKFDQNAILSKLEASARYSRRQIEDGFFLGGLPGICFSRDPSVRNSKFRTQIETLLSRDIEMIAPTDVGFVKLRSLLIGVLKESGGPINHSRLAKIAGLSPPTVKRLIGALEALFLIRRHGSTFYGTDTGLTHSLIREWEPDSRSFLLSTLFMELTRQLSYGFPNSYEFLDFRSRGGVDVPFVIKMEGHGPIALVPDHSEGASDKSLISLTWFRKKHRNAKTFVLHRGKRAYLSSAGHVCLPYEMIY